MRGRYSKLYGTLQDTYSSGDFLSPHVNATAAIGTTENTEPGKIKFSLSYDVF